MKLILAAVVFAASATAAVADTQSKAIKLTDAQLATLTAGGSISVDNRDRTVSKSNQGVEGTTLTKFLNQTTICKPPSACGG
jgi:hypothetical protein